MKVVNPAWTRACKVEIASRDLSKNDFYEQSGCKSREYGSAVLNGRAISEKYAGMFSSFLGITEPYLIDVDVG